MDELNRKIYGAGHRGMVCSASVQQLQGAGIAAFLFALVRKSTAAVKPLVRIHET